MFLLKTGIGKEAFVATGIVLAVMVDMTRIVVYGAWASAYSEDMHWGLVVVACICAFLGAYIGARVPRKVTIRAVQISVSSLLVLVSIGLITGLV